MDDEIKYTAFWYSTPAIEIGTNILETQILKRVWVFCTDMLKKTN